MAIATDIAEIDRIVLQQLHDEIEPITVPKLYDKLLPKLSELDQRIRRPDFVASIWRLVDAGDAELLHDRKVQAKRRQG